MTLVLVAGIFLVVMCGIRLFAFGLSEDMTEIWVHGTYCVNGVPMCKACKEKA